MREVTRTGRPSYGRAVSRVGRHPDVLAVVAAALLVVFVYQLGPGKMSVALLSALAMAGVWRWPKAVLLLQAMLLLLGGVASKSGSAFPLPMLLVAAGVVAYRWRAGRAAVDAPDRAASLAQRTRLARELHDVVGHHVAAMTLRATSANLVLASSGDSTVAATALDDVASTGRKVLDELHGLLLRLRAPDTEEAATAADPEEMIRDDVQRARAVGVPISVVVDPAISAVPPALRVTIASAVREALTNVLKHAGPGTPTTVTVELTRAPSIRALVRNARPDSAPPVLPSSGHGLAGIRDRVALLGGWVQAGPEPGGGWSVSVELPVGVRR
jgi:signal transduction histidine kinase